MTMFMSGLKIMTKENNLPWMYLLDAADIRSLAPSSHVELLRILWLRCLSPFLNYLVTRFRRQAMLAWQSWYLLCVSPRGLPCYSRS